MVVQHNLTAMNSNRMLGLTVNSQAKSTEKLSSGYKINRAADDAAGLSISEKMRKQIRGLTQASLNAQDGISAVQTAEGALNEVQDMLQRMNELAVKSSNGTMSESDRSYIQNEIDQLVDEIDRVSETTKFNETYLLKGAGTETTEAGNEVGVSMWDSGEYAGYEATIREATGNKFEGVITSTLGKGTDEGMTIKYKDAEGHDREVALSFVVGEDDKETAANIAAAINADEKLSSLFEASSDAEGNLTVESKMNKYELETADSCKITGMFFDSSDEAGEATLMTQIDGASGTTSGGTSTAAVGESYVLDITTLADGDTVTVDGTTYTFDSGRTAGTDTLANSFSTAEELVGLLGSDYNVSLEYSATQNVTYSANDIAGGDENIVDKAVSFTYANATQKIGDLVDGGTDEITDAAYDVNAEDSSLLSPNATAAADGAPQVTYTDAKLSLVITKNKQPEEQVEDVTTEDALTLSFQVGADTTPENKISVDVESMSAKSLGVDGLKVDGKDSTNADAAVETIAAAIEKVSAQRSALGAVQNRLEHTIANLDNVVENTTAAESQIRDTDMATEMVKYSNNNILAQAGQAMLAQANQSNQGVLSLLG